MDIYGSKRLNGESQEDYKLRLKEEKKFFKNRLKGVQAFPHGVTYVKELHGDIQVSISNDQ